MYFQYKQIMFYYISRFFSLILSVNLKKMPVQTKLTWTLTEKKGTKAVTKAVSFQKVLYTLCTFKVPIDPF